MNKLFIAVALLSMSQLVVAGPHHTEADSDHSATRHWHSRSDNAGIPAQLEALRQQIASLPVNQLGVYAGATRIGSYLFDGWILSEQGYMVRLGRSDDGSRVEPMPAIWAIYFANADCTGAAYIEENYHDYPRLLIFDNGHVTQVVNSTAGTRQIYSIASGAEVLSSVTYESKITGVGDFSCTNTSGTADGVVALSHNDPSVTGIQDSYPYPLHLGVQ